MSDPTPPKVFLSHASEDKDFVVGFASQLRKRGVDVWLDRWEILPGDSLVDKIFEEGIAKAKAIIVVLSRHSIDKPWVREELDAAVVRKINHVSRLIPVVIDDCKVPEALRATVWEKIDDLKNYKASLDRVVMAIFGETDKPPVGKGPAFAAKPTLTVGDLSRVDSLVLQAACEVPLEGAFTDVAVNLGQLHSRCKKLGISDEAAQDSVAALQGRGYAEKEMGIVRITRLGFEQYLKVHWPSYDALLKQFASDVVNEGLLSSQDMRKSLKVPKLVVDHILDEFMARKWISSARYGSGEWDITEGSVSPEMKRWLDS